MHPDQLDIDDALARRLVAGQFPRWAGLSRSGPACRCGTWRPPARSTPCTASSDVAVDRAQWMRGRGLALSKGLVALPYYVTTNPGFAVMARSMIEQVLTDLELTAPSDRVG